MDEMVVGGVSYRIVVVERDGQHVAHAERADNSDRFGIDCAGDSREDAATRLKRWLEWQYEHVSALAELQKAEHAYHRTIAGSAFASPIEGPSALELQKESLDALEAARLRLDEIRARRPE